MPVKGGETHMRKHLTVSSKLVIQGGGTVMTSVGEVPVIFVPDLGDNVEQYWMEFLAMAINFIRCGCSEAMLYSPSVARMGNTETLWKFEGELKKAFRILSPTQKISFSAGGDGSILVFPGREE
jgi:hypothetical protein